MEFYTEEEAEEILKNNKDKKDNTDDYFRRVIDGV